MLFCAPAPAAPVPAHAPVPLSRCRRAHCARAWCRARSLGFWLGLLAGFGHSAAVDAAPGAAQPHALGAPQAAQLAPALWGLGLGAHPGDPGRNSCVGMPGAGACRRQGMAAKTTHALAAVLALLAVPGGTTTAGTVWRSASWCSIGRRQGQPALRSPAARRAQCKMRAGVCRVQYAHLRVCACAHLWVTSCWQTTCLTTALYWEICLHADTMMAGRPAPAVACECETANSCWRQEPLLKNKHHALC